MYRQFNFQQFFVLLTLCIYVFCVDLRRNRYYFPIRTYSMVQSPFWAANWFATSQEIPRISRNPKVHYRTHKPPQPVSIQGQANPVHIPTSHLLEIHPNIIHPSTPRSPQWSISLRFPHQDPIHPLSSPIRAICPAHLTLVDFITRTILGLFPYTALTDWFLGSSAKLRKVTITFVMFVSLSVRMEQLGSHWTNFYEILFVSISKIRWENPSFIEIWLN